MVRDYVVFLTFLLVLSCDNINAGPEEEHGVIYANRCETCKILATELESRLSETGKTRAVLELG